MRLAVLFVLSLLGGAALAQSQPAGPLFMGYYASWNELPVATPRLSKLAQLPPGIDVAAIAFVKPDLKFDGTSLDGTGLTLPPNWNAKLLADSVAAFRQTHPKAKILLSVGGSVYNKSWSEFAARPLLKLVQALGVDGVDLDFEPANPGCGRAGATFTCASEADWARIIRQTRDILPRPAIIAAQGWSVGAYGVGAFAGDVPASPFTGSMLWLARLPEAKEIDILAIMAYDAGPKFVPERAFDAYRAVWPGRLLLGVDVPEEDSVSPPFSVPRLKQLARQQAGNGLGGIMLWTATAELKAGPSLTRPDGEIAAGAICEGLGRDGC